MPLQIQVSDEQIHKPTVARALAQLLLALGGEAPVSAPAVAPPAVEPLSVAPPAPPVVAAPVVAPPVVEAPVVKAPVVKAPAVKAPVVVAPAPVAPREPDAPAPPATEDAPAAAQAQPPAPKVKGERPKATRQRKAPAPPAPAPKVPWATFVAGLSRNTRIFLDVLESRGRLTITAAQAALGVAPKGVGGITGALARKAANHDMPLPYSTAKSKTGQRMWIWRPAVAAKLGIEPPAKAAAADSAGEAPKDDK